MLHLPQDIIQYIPPKQRYCGLPANIFHFVIRISPAILRPQEIRHKILHDPLIANENDVKIVSFILPRYAPECENCDDIRMLA